MKITESLSKEEKVKIFDRLKTGQEIEIEYDSSIRKGSVSKFVVGKKAKVMKGKVEKITLYKDGNKSGMKFFLYKRGGDSVSFAMGDMGATINSIKESTELEEEVKVGDKVHLGFGTKGGAGFKGEVTKIEKGFVYIKNSEGKEYKGPLRLVTKESTDLEEATKKGMSVVLHFHDYASQKGFIKRNKIRPDEIISQRKGSIEIYWDKNDPKWENSPFVYQMDKPKPYPDWKESTELEEDARMIYNNLADRFLGEISPIEFYDRKTNKTLIKPKDKVSRAQLQTVSKVADQGSLDYRSPGSDKMFDKVVKIAQKAVGQGQKGISTSDLSQQQMSESTGTIVGAEKLPLPGKRVWRSVVRHNNIHNYTGNHAYELQEQAEGESRLWQSLVEQRRSPNEIQKQIKKYRFEIEYPRN